MAIKEILVHVDNAAAATRLGVAAGLAVAHGAHVTGLYIRPPAGGQLADNWQEEADRQAQVPHDAFVSRMGHAVAADWLDITGDLVETLDIQARYADLAVVGQSPVHDGLTDERRLGGHLVVNSGRPVLVVPDDGAVSRFSRAMIAWNGSREAIRAIVGAIPILRQVRQVEVLMISAQPVAPSAPPPGARICAYLGRHGISAETTVLRDDPVHGIGGLILAHAAEQKADLIVMGAFGRSRIRETMLGSVSGKVMTGCRIPVLLAH